MFSGSISSTRSKIDDRLLVVAQLVADQRAQLHRARDAQRRLLGQEQLPLGHLDDARPVLVALVVGAQAVVRDDVARVDLGDQLLERQRGGVGVVQLLVEDLRALQADVGGAARLLGERHLALEDLRTSVIQSAWLLQMRASESSVSRSVGSRSSSCSHDLRARCRSRSWPSTSRASWRRNSACCAGVGDDALDLQVQDAGQVLVPVQRRIDLDQRGQRLAVVRDPGARPLPAAAPPPAGSCSGPRRMPAMRCRICQLLVGVRGVFGVQIEHVHQLGGLAGALEDPFQARQRVAIARHRRAGSRSPPTAPARGRRSARRR